MSDEELTLIEQDEIEEKRRAELREKSKGMVLTDIDLPFERVLWVSFQFFIAGLIIALPIWLVIFFIVS